MAWLTNYVWGSTQPDPPIELVSIVDDKKVTHAAQKALANPERDPDISTVESNSKKLMRELGRKESEYYSYWFFLREPDDFSIDMMGDLDIVRAACDEGDAIFIRICRESDKSHQILLCLIERKFVIKNDYLGGILSSEEVSDWGFSVLQVPEGSRFDPCVFVPVIENTASSASFFMDISQTIYDSDSIANVTCQELLQKLLNREPVALDRCKPDEVYCLWSKHF